jgi:hypothetical protein
MKLKDIGMLLKFKIQVQKFYRHIKSDIIDDDDASDILQFITLYWPNSGNSHI